MPQYTVGVQNKAINIKQRWSSSETAPTNRNSLPNTLAAADSLKTLEETFHLLNHTFKPRCS